MSASAVLSALALAAAQAADVERIAFSILRLHLGDAAMNAEIIVPVFMCCALLWWFSQGMSWTRRAAVTAITLAVIVCILLFERWNG